MGSARVELSVGLAVLVRRRVRDGVATVDRVDRRSVKDVVESLGVPHTEVGAVVVDGEEVAWDHLLGGGEAVFAHGIGEVPPTLAGLVRPPPLPRPVRTVADVHLGALARRLRIVGVDTRWRADAEDAWLAATAAEDGRVLLTRDRGLLMRRAVVHGVLVRSDDPNEQLVQVLDRLAIDGAPAPGTVCPRCNGPVEQVDAAAVRDRLEPGTRAAGHDVVGRCRACGRLYWPGAHATAVDAIVARARSR